MSVKRTPENIGKRIAVADLEYGTDVVACPANPTPRQKHHNSCNTGTFAGLRYFNKTGRNGTVIVYLQYDFYGKPAFNEVWFPVKEHHEDGSMTLDESQHELFLRKYGTVIEEVMEKGKLPAGVEIELAEMLTGKRPKSFLPPKKVGGRTRKAKGQKYHKQAGRPLTRRARTSSR
jgi:hypothetical protein